MKAIIFEYKGNKTLIIAETMEQLNNGFSYTLEVGHSWKSSVSLNPRTPRSLVSNLDKCDMVYGYYNSNYYSLDEKRTKDACKLLNKEELLETKEGSSGCWKDITDEEFNKLIKNI